MTLSFSQYPELQSVGGHVALQANGYSDPNCQQSDVVVVLVAAGQYVAYGAGCPHACCVVTYNGNNFHCGCHGAQFDVMTGTSAGIRTNQPLPSLKVCADANGVTISW
jgi:Rieske Fe-S protein